MITNKRVSDDVIIEAYKRLGNIYKVADEVGLHHSSVHERLIRMGIPRNNPHFSQAEYERLKQEYLIYRDAGKIGELADKMGRTKHFLARKARELGLTNPKHNRMYDAKWKYMSEETARLLFEKFKKSRYTMTQFCSKYGIGNVFFSLTMRKFFPDEWEYVIELKAPKQTKYRYGRAFEYRVRDDLRRNGYFAMRSPRSGSPVDLVGIKTGIVLFIQCKRNGALCVNEWNVLYDLSQSVGAIPILASTPTGEGINYWKIIGKKDSNKRNRQPREPYSIRSGNE